MPRNPTITEERIATLERRVATLEDSAKPLPGSRMRTIELLEQINTRMINMPASKAAKMVGSAGKSMVGFTMPPRDQC